MERILNGIGGETAASASSRTSAVFNPATGEQVAELPLSTVEEVNQAVAAAKQAAPAWGRTPPLKRAALMFRFRELVGELGNLESQFASTVSSSASATPLQHCHDVG